MRQRFYYLLILFLSVNLLIAQESPYYTNLNRKEMQMDLDSLKNTLQAYHPGLNRYNNEVDILAYIDSAKLELPDSLNVIAFQHQVAEMVALVGCSHTRMRTPLKWNAYYDEQAMYIPFNLTYINGHYFVNETFDQTLHIKVGDQIEWINNMSIEGYMAQINPLISSDGNSPDRKRAAIKTGFYWYSGYIFGTEMSHYKIQVKKGHLNQLIEVPAVTRQQIKDIRKATKKEMPLAEGHWAESGIFYFKVNSFAIQDTRQNKFEYGKMIDSIYWTQRADTAKHIVLDFRGNPGGLSEMGALLCLYFMPEPFVYCRALEMKTNLIPKNLPYEALPSYPDFPNGIREKDGKYYWVNHPALGKFTPMEGAFSGDLIVLCDGGSNSTTTEVISVLHDRPKTRFAGSSPGGAYVGSNSGIEIELTLPNSGIRVLVPLIAYHIRNENPYSTPNLQVDIPLSPDPKAEKDLILEELLRKLAD